jgi:hypothetical protein
MEWYKWWWAGVGGCSVFVSFFLLEKIKVIIIIFATVIATVSCSTIFIHHDDDVHDDYDMMIYAEDHKPNIIILKH